jgi:ADP-heptose:LPS heptosyltransferase
MHFTDFITAQLRLADVPAADDPDLAWLDAPLDRVSLPARYVVLSPGCAPGRDYKRWPAASYAEIAKRLKAKGIDSIAVGTKTDKDAITGLKKAAPDVIDLSGKTSLQQLATLARHAACVIGNDTGPVHLMAAIGPPTLALMSEKVDPVWSAPRGPHVQWAQGKPLASLSPDEVFLALGPLLDRNN